MKKLFLLFLVIALGVTAHYNKYWNVVGLSYPDNPGNVACWDVSNIQTVKFQVDISVSKCANDGPAYSALFGSINQDKSTVWNVTKWWQPSSCGWNWYSANIYDYLGVYPPGWGGFDSSGGTINLQTDTYSWQGCIDFPWQVYGNTSKDLDFRRPASITASCGGYAVSCTAPTFNFVPKTATVSMSQPPSTGWYSQDDAITFTISLGSCSSCGGVYHLEFAQSEANVVVGSSYSFNPYSGTVPVEVPGRSVSISPGGVGSITLKIRDLEQERLVRGMVQKVRAVRAEQGTQYPGCYSGFDSLKINYLPYFNYAPFITPPVPYVSDPIKCNAAATDPNDFQATSLYYSFVRYPNDGSAPVWQDSYSDTYDCPLLGCAIDDRVSCKVRAYDRQLPNLFSEYSEVEIVVGNRPPEVGVPVLSPQSPGPSTVITCTATANDPDSSSAVNVEYAFEKNSEGFSSWRSRNEFDCGSSSCNGGDVVKCKARAQDPLKPSVYSESVPSSVTVVNTPTEFLAPSISPPNPSVADLLTCTAFAYDRDGGTPVVQYAFARNTGAFSSWSNDNTFQCSFDKGCRVWDTIKCKARAFDPQDAGVVVESPEASVKYNTIPNLTVSDVMADLPFDAKYDVNADGKINYVDLSLAENSSNNYAFRSCDDEVADCGQEAKPSCEDYGLELKCDYDRDGVVSSSDVRLMSSFMASRLGVYTSGGLVTVRFRNSGNGSSPSFYSMANLWKLNGYTESINDFTMPALKPGAFGVVTLNVGEVEQGPGTYPYKVDADVGYYGRGFVEESNEADNSKTVNLNFVNCPFSCSIVGVDAAQISMYGFGYGVQCFNNGERVACPQVSWTGINGKVYWSGVNGFVKYANGSDQRFNGPSAYYAVEGNVGAMVVNGSGYCGSTGFSCSKRVNGLNCTVSGPSTVPGSARYAVECTSRGYPTQCPEMHWRSSLLASFNPVSGLASTYSSTMLGPDVVESVSNALTDSTYCRKPVQVIATPTPTPSAATPTPSVTSTPSVVTPTPRAVTPTPSVPTGQTYVDVSCPPVATQGTAEFTVFQVVNGVPSCTAPSVVVARKSTSTAGLPFTSTVQASLDSCNTGTSRYSIQVAPASGDAPNSRITYDVTVISSGGASKTCSITLLASEPAKAPDLNLLVVLLAALAAAAITSRRK